VKRFALIIKQDMLIVCGMQFEPARYTSAVRNHLSQNVATYALRLTVTLRILNCQYKSLAKKKITSSQIRHVSVIGVSAKSINV